MAIMLLIDNSSKDKFNRCIVSATAKRLARNRFEHPTKIKAMLELGTPELISTLVLLGDDKLCHGTFG